MDIALLNKKVTFQANELVTDEIGNHSNVWTDHYTCMATISGEAGLCARSAVGAFASLIVVSSSSRQAGHTRVSCM